MWYLEFKNRLIDCRSNRALACDILVQNKRKTNNLRGLCTAVFSLVLVIVLPIGCKQKEANSEPDLNAQLNALFPPESTPPPEAASNAPLAIKGFEINMSRRAAWENLNRLGFPTVNTNIIAPEHILDTAFSPRGGKIMLTFTDDPLELNRLDIVSPLVDQLFNVSDLSLEDFVQKFADEYHIPEMKPFTQGTIYGWRYNDEDNGYEIVVWASGSFGKCITFRRVPTRGERKFD